MKLDVNETEQAPGHIYGDVPSAPANPSPSVYAKGNRIAIVIIAVCLVLITAMLCARFWPSHDDPRITAPTDPADYTLAGVVRYVYTQSGSGLYMRAAPNSDGAVVAGIPDGRAVIIQKTQDSWAYVTWDSYEGWCSMNYLLTEEEHAQKLQEFLNIPAIVATENDPLRLRETPSKEGNTLESMPKDSLVVVLRIEDEWAYVDYQGMSGWCSLKYLELQE